MNKRALRAAVVLLLAVFTLSGCGGSGDGTAAATRPCASGATAKMSFRSV